MLCPHKIRRVKKTPHKKKELTVPSLQVGKFAYRICLEFDDKLGCTPWNVGRENKRSCCLLLVCSRTSLLVRGSCSLHS